MYTFKKEEILTESKQKLSEGYHIATLVNIDDTTSKKGDRMLKVYWKINDESDTTIYDYILPEHENEMVRNIAKKKLTSMANAMLDQSLEEVNLFDCMYKEANVLVKLKEGQDGQMYPRIVSIKRPLLVEKTVSNKTANNKEDKNVLIDDDVPF